ncbi:bifunctional diacylglycerol diphosphate phosphatase/phosphatidate phosphatase [Kluyveromyces lactis]|uniref:KLLA0C10835p n=1 Tax=Kluyveromyces lactis (strain ATCC 8585 / CBS 2359 / DSM 70799 / NBRC 1267 / NRRL Y-1140 / WM37) TaxID=284590 RepID=Q6CTQ6_KLULA|nr:uncharacterized protein KLLA0_C10835g [Kluyveromyces lactis]CAH01534.1 KLLA0C10835p [Kluyveromyces lactis]|eukprot:XP_452683.1 uncharacterized protein KLLA0_C10835g [Kluyveromyces lactis]
MGIDRVSFGTDRLKFYKSLKKWKLTDLILCVVLFLVNIPVYYQKPFQRQFFINDLTISHPFAEVEMVNNHALIVYSYFVPFFTIILFSLLLADSKHRWYLMYISLLGLSFTWISTSLLTNYLKNWFGRHRPDFLARCAPKHGTPKNTLVYAIDVCTSTDYAVLYDGFRTTPSGHSSESFAGLGFLFLWLCGQLLTELPETGSWRTIVACLPLVGASVIALSRTQDYRHHFVDVMLGSLLGILVAHWSYRRYFPSIHSKLPFKPLLDDSDVVLEEYSQVRSSGTDEELLPISRSTNNN